MTNNHIRYYISYLNLTGTVKHNSTNKSFIYCLWIPFCKLFKPCNRVGSSGKNSWYSRSWLPKTRFWLQFDLVFKLPKLWSQYLANYFQKYRYPKKTSQLAWTQRNLQQWWAYVTKTINKMKKSLVMDSILREEKDQWRESTECIINCKKSI